MRRLGTHHPYKRRLWCSHCRPHKRRHCWRANIPILRHKSLLYKDFVIAACRVDRACAYAEFATVGVAARIVVVAKRCVVHMLTAVVGVATVISARGIVVAEIQRAAADAVDARIIFGAKLAVVAGVSLRAVVAIACFCIATVGSAHIGVVTIFGRSSNAAAVDAGVAHSTTAAVVARVLIRCVYTAFGRIAFVVRTRAAVVAN